LIPRVVRLTIYAGVKFADLKKWTLDSYA